MNHLRPFLLLAGRPAAFFLILINLLVSLGVILILRLPEFPGAPADLAFLIAFVIPALIGATAGQAIQEMQHCSFTWSLPGVRWKTALGFLASGAAVTLLAVGLSWNLEAATGHLVLLAVGLSAYCLGSLFDDPLSSWLSVAAVTLALLVALFSAGWAVLADENTVVTAGLVTPAMIALSLRRLFSRSTFRRKPFLPTRTLADSLSFEPGERYEREKLMAKRPGRRRWRPVYLGSGTWSWIRASWYETWGDGRRAVLATTRFWPAVLLVTGAYAVGDEGGESYLEAFAKTFYHAFFRPPEMPSFGELPDPHLMVMLVVSLIGPALAFSAPVAVESDRGYPLSRGDRCRIAFWGHLANLALFALTAGLGFFLIAQTVGWAVGYGLRLDFLPHYLRVLLATLVLMPLVWWFRLRNGSCESWEPGERAVAMIFGILLIWIAIGMWSFLVPLMLPSAVAEVATLAVLLALSLWSYRRNLVRYFATADLV